MSDLPGDRMPCVITSVEFSQRPSARNNQIVYIAKAQPTADAARLAAAVVWRITPSPRRRRWRELIRRIRHYFGPFGIGLHLRWNVQPWTGSSGPYGEQETRYNPERRVVWALGSEYPLPSDGRTLVLLIDESAGGRPIVRTQKLDLPPVPRPSIQAAVQAIDQEDTWADDSWDETSTWRSLLAQDPMIREFIADDAPAG